MQIIGLLLFIKHEVFQLPLFLYKMYSLFRRINIRHMFPNEVPLDVRLRCRFPRNQHKVSLRCLSLRGYKRITDTTLYYIKHLNLELLDLTYTSVTKGGIENFLIENPNCRIIHQNYCRCKPKNPF